MSKPKVNIREDLRHFSQETHINGIKELFEQETAIGLKEPFFNIQTIFIFIFVFQLVWGIFLLSCAGSMVRQLVVLGIAYEKELTLTTVSLEEVERNRTSNLNMCINMSALVTENADIKFEDDVASYLGQFRVGSFVIHQTGKPVWLDGNLDYSTAIGISALRNIPAKPGNALPLSYEKRVNKVLSIFNITDLWAVSLRGSSGSHGNVWCLIIDYNDAQLKAEMKETVEPEDFYMGFDATIPLRLSLSFYTLTDEPFREASVHTLRMTSSVIAAKKRQHAAHIDKEKIRVAHQDATVFDTHINLKLQARKYTFLDLRRKPCTTVSDDYILPVGKGRATCYDSCMINAFKHRYDCIFERHFNVFKGTDEVKFCHWFDIIRTFRDELHYNCSTGGLIPNPPEVEHNEYFYDITHESLLHDLTNKTSVHVNAPEDYQDFDTFNPKTICELKANVSVWTKYIMYLIKQDLEDKYIRYCIWKCSYFRPCVQWEMEYGHVQRLKIFHNDTEEFMSMYVTKPDIIANYEEKLETNVEGLIASIGGIFGFYFGFSVVAIVHVVFFCVYRYLSYRKTPKLLLEEEATFVASPTVDSFV